MIALYALLSFAALAHVCLLFVSVDMAGKPVRTVTNQDAMGSLMISLVVIGTFIGVRMLSADSLTQLASVMLAGLWAGVTLGTVGRIGVPPRSGVVKAQRTAANVAANGVALWVIGYMIVRV